MSSSHSKLVISWPWPWLVPAVALLGGVRRGGGLLLSLLPPLLAQQVRGQRLYSEGCGIVCVRERESIPMKMRSCMRGTVDWETQLNRSLLVSSIRIFSISWRMSSEKSLTSCLISPAQIASMSATFWRRALENSAQAATKRDTAARTSTMVVLRLTSLGEE